MSARTDKCRSCKAPVEWHETEAGKPMICNPGIVNVMDIPAGQKLLTTEGKTITGSTNLPYHLCYGHVTHWSTCPDANNWHGKKR